MSPRCVPRSSARRGRSGSTSMTSSSSRSAERVRQIATVLGAWLVLVAGVLVSIVVGGGEIGSSETLRSLGSHIGLPVEPLSTLADTVIWQLRAPRALMAAVAGAGLATCGALLQAVTRNALAEPYLLGISSGASTGAALVMVTGLGAGAPSLAAGALVGGLVAFGLVLALLGQHASNTGRLVLTGVVVGPLFHRDDIVGSARVGRRGRRAWLDVLADRVTGSRALACCRVMCRGHLIALVVTRLLHPTRCLRFRCRCLRFTRGACTAVRSIALVATAAVTAVVVSAVGAIGFVGLIVPRMRSVP